MDTKRKYFENSLLDFYKFYVRKKFPNLSRHARRVASLLLWAIFLENEAHQNQM